MKLWLMLGLVTVVVLVALIVMGIISEITETPEKMAPPVAQISSYPSIVKIGESISFSAIGSTDSDEKITSYEWDFGDGNTASGASVVHNYLDKGGTHNIKLRVIYDDVVSDIAEISVKVMTGITIKIEATATTWREGLQPYDIYGAIKEELEQAGLEVAPEESTVCDAILYVEYEEKEGGVYDVKRFEGGRLISETRETGTSIICILRLVDNTRGQIFEKEISASTPELTGNLYYGAVHDFEEKVYHRYLGEIIATKFGFGDEVSVLIDALQDLNSNTRADAEYALGKTEDERAIQPLILPP